MFNIGNEHFVFVMNGTDGSIIFQIFTVNHLIAYFPVCPCLSAMAGSNTLEKRSIVLSVLPNVSIIHRLCYDH